MCRRRAVEQRPRSARAMVPPRERPQRPPSLLSAIARGGRSVSDLPTVPEASPPPEDGIPMSDAAACSPSRLDVPSDVMDAAAALVSASSGGVHVSCALLCTLLLMHAVWRGNSVFSALLCLVRTAVPPHEPETWPALMLERCPA